jgi:hypothetical protein
VVLLIPARAWAQQPSASPSLLATQQPRAPILLVAPTAPTTISVAAPATGILERVPTASWAMGCTAGVALVVHAVYQNLSDKRRAQLAGSCAGNCPEYRVDHYRESRERSEVALRLSVLAAASAIWLVYNDPQEALDRMAQRKPPPKQRGVSLKVKPERRGVWASVVAYF